MVIAVVVEVVVVIPATICAVSQDVVDRQAHLLDSNETPLDCWTMRHEKCALVLASEISGRVCNHAGPLEDLGNRF